MLALTLALCACSAEGDTTPRVTSVEGGGASQAVTSGTWSKTDSDGKTTSIKIEDSKITLAAGEKTLLDGAAYEKKADGTLEAKGKNGTTYIIKVNEDGSVSVKSRDKDGNTSPVAEFGAEDKKEPSGGNEEGPNDEAAEVTLTFKDGEEVLHIISGKSGAALERPEAPEKTGYTFSGWNPELPAKFPNEDKTYSAVWTREGDWTISYNNLEDGTNAASNPAGYNAETALPIVLAAPTRTGYDFAGWYKDAGFASKTEEIPQGSTGAVSLWAKWEAKTVTLTFNLNGGSGTETLSGRYGESVSAPANPTKTGFIFTGWNPALPETFLANETYTAQWQEGYEATAATVAEVIRGLSGDGTYTVRVSGPIDDDAIRSIKPALDSLKRSSPSTRVYLDLSQCTELTKLGSGSIWDDGVFYKCTNLVGIVIPNSVTYICRSFNGCTSLKSVVIPEGVNYIGFDAFKNCTSLENVVIPDGVTYIDSGAFENCTSLESVVIPDGVTSIDNYAFDGCTSLGSVVIPGSVTSIGDGAFANCTGLESVVIKSEVFTSIGKSAFQSCTSLKSVVIEGDGGFIGNSAFQGCTSLESVVIPGSVSYIGTSAFQGCTSLESVVIPDGVNYYIGTSAFRGCTSLKSMVIPDGVTSIDSDAFKDCTSLESVTVKAERPPSLSSGAFANVASSFKIYVPADSVDAYRAAYGWKSYKIVPIPE